MSTPKTTLLNDFPDEKLPDFWKDQSRINALYAPFRERSVNPRDYDSKLTFWKGIIETFCSYNQMCTFTAIELKKYFIQNGRTPACLPDVITQMFNSGELQDLNEFLTPPKSWTGWAFDLAIKKPVSWGINKIFSPKKNGIEVTYVHLASVKKQATDFFNRIKSEDRNRLLSFTEVLSNYDLNGVSVETVKLWLHQLKLNGQLDTIEYKSSENFESVEKSAILMLKFAPPNGKLETISNIDVARCSLEENERNIMKKIEDLEKEKEKAMENTRSFLKKGMKQMAKSWLRREHQLGKNIEQQTKVLDNVGALIERLNAAETDGKTLAAYRSGLDALKNAFEQAGISEEKVDDTMADVQEVLDMHDDVQTTLSQPLNPSLESELEQELEALLNREEDNTVTPPNEGGKKTELPSPPKHNISEEDDLMRRLAALKTPLESPEDKNRTPTMHNLL